MSEPALVLDTLVRTFSQGPRKVEVLKGASLAIRPGETVSVRPSAARNRRS